LKNFAAKLSSLTSQKQALSIRTRLMFTLDQKISEKILGKAGHLPTHRLWKLEESIVLRSQESSFMNVVDELMASGQAWQIPLKLMCLYSFVNGGIKQKYYDLFRRDFCQAYGPNHIFTFQYLEKLGLLTSVSPASVTNFSSLSKGLRLVNEYESNTAQSDVSYVYAGYAPISLRLIQLASNSIPGSDSGRNSKVNGSSPLSWGSNDIISLLPGKTFERSVIPENRSYKSASISSPNIRNK
jgi:hypothetical protein